MKGLVRAIAMELTSPLPADGLFMFGLDFLRRKLAGDSFCLFFPIFFSHLIGYEMFSFVKLLHKRWLCHVVCCDTLCFTAELFAFAWSKAFFFSFSGIDRLRVHLKFTLLLAGILHRDETPS